MQRGFRGNLPTERRQQGTANPHQYITVQNQSSNSNDSQDSMMTQVPLQYYQGPGGHPQAYQPNGQMMYHQQYAAPQVDQHGQFVGAPGYPSATLNPMQPSFIPSNGDFGNTQQMYLLPMNSANHEQMGGMYSQQLGGNGYMQQNSGQSFDQSMQGMADAQYQTSGQYNAGVSQYVGGAMDVGGYQYAPTYNAPAGNYQYHATSASVMSHYGSNVSGSPVTGSSKNSLGATFGASVGGQGGVAQSRAGMGGRGVINRRGGMSPDVQPKRRPALRHTNRGQTINSSRRGGQGDDGGLRAASDGYTSNLATAPVLTNMTESSRAAVSNISSNAPSVQAPSDRPDSRGSSHNSCASAVNLSTGHSAPVEGQDLSRNSASSEQTQVLESASNSELSQVEPRTSNHSSAIPRLAHRHQSTLSLPTLPSEPQRRHTITESESVNYIIINDLIKSPPVENTKDTNMLMSFQQASPQTLNLSLMAPGGITPSMLSSIQENDASIKNTSQRRAVGVIGSQLPSSQSTTPVKPPPSVRSLIDPFGPSLSMAVPHNSGGLFNSFSNQMSPLLRAITSNGTARPDVATGLAPMNLPFSEMCRDAKEDTWGVIRLRNIPYTVNRSEVLAFLGRNARLISESDYEPVHIVMERVTSKTLDCFVEFISFSEALSAVNRFEVNKSGGRTGRLGSRHVEVEMSTQSALMMELFPKTKNVTWRGGKPEITPWNPDDQYNSGFQGFVSKEELVMLVKHVEAPQRSPFSKDCPQRPFECLISTLIKYPWYAVQHITIEDRNRLHEATKSLVELLVERVEQCRDEVNLTRMLLKRVLRAALRCPGFTPVMKEDISYLARVEDSVARDMGVPPFADHWGVLWTIGPKPGVPSDVLLWYIAIIRETTEGVRPTLTLAQRAAQGNEEPEGAKFFGNLEKYISHRPGLLKQTLQEVAQAEWEAIEYVLTHAFTPHSDARRIEG